MHRKSPRRQGCTALLKEQPCASNSCDSTRCLQSVQSYAVTNRSKPLTCPLLKNCVIIRRYASWSERSTNVRTEPAYAVLPGLRNACKWPIRNRAGRTHLTEIFKLSRFCWDSLNEVHSQRCRGAMLRGVELQPQKCLKCQDPAHLRTSSCARLCWDVTLVASRMKTPQRKN